MRLWSPLVLLLQDLLRVVEAARELLVQERREKLHLEMQLREEICNEMVEHLQQKEQWCRCEGSGMGTGTCPLLRLSLGFRPPN